MRVEFPCGGSKDASGLKISPAPVFACSIEGAWTCLSLSEEVIWGETRDYCAWNDPRVASKATITCLSITVSPGVTHTDFYWNSFGWGDATKNPCMVWWDGSREQICESPKHPSPNLSISFPSTPQTDFSPSSTSAYFFLLAFLLVSSYCFSFILCSFFSVPISTTPPHPPPSSTLHPPPTSPSPHLPPRLLRAPPH